MTDSLSRLAWALPLVIALGVLAILVIRRVLQTAHPANDDAPMTLRQSLKLSEDAQLHLVSLGGQSILVVESSGPSALQVLMSPPPTPRSRGLSGTGRP